ncbi:hypothetical protein [uncultured Ferrovibrio sp.]|jgi:hypothetical protein|uniref:hypothetical protein n=1 Tax=uncultured Ferrovibrio sp. TaxID=1576913 RepID=UPI002627D5FC|nr:hypothetical protein [uncultured Ferrovibrio sp.]
MQRSELERHFLVLRDTVDRARRLLAEYAAADHATLPDNFFDPFVAILFDEDLDLAGDMTQIVSAGPMDDFLVQDYAVLHTAVRRARLVLTWHFRPEVKLSAELCCEALEALIQNEGVEAAGNFEPLLMQQSPPRRQAG